MLAPDGCCSQHPPLLLLLPPLLFKLLPPLLLKLLPLRVGLQGWPVRLQSCMCALAPGAARMAPRSGQAACQQRDPDTACPQVCRAAMQQLVYVKRDCLAPTRYHARQRRHQTGS